MFPCGPSKPLADPLIGRIGSYRFGELLGSDSSKLHETFIQWAGIDVFTLGSREDGPAFVDHARKMHIAFHLNAHAAGEFPPEIHVGFRVICDS